MSDQFLYQMLTADQQGD